MLRSVVAVALAGSLALIVAGCGGSSGSSGKGSSVQDRINQAMKEQTPETRARKLMKLAVLQAKGHDTFGAEKTMQLAGRACEEITDPLIKADAFIELGEAQLKLKKRSEAKKAAIAARKAAEKIETPETSATGIARAGQLQAAAGDPDGAAEALAKAEKLAADLKDPVSKTQVLCIASSGYDKALRTADADRAMAAALEAARAAAEPRKQGEAIAVVAVQQHKMKKPEAEATFNLALETIRKDKDTNMKTYALIDLAEKLVGAGMQAKAREVLNEADETAHKIEAQDLQQMAIEKVRATMGKLLGR